MCEFKIPFSGPADNLLRRAKQELERAGGSFDGDEFSGLFKGKTPLGSIAGSYQIAGQEIFIVISKKPFLLPCRKIESELRGVMV